MFALFVTTIRLHLRNKMALIYSYLFPTIFLLAFWVLYRYEPVPLVRHMGELLTVTALGGACFGLPMAIGMPMPKHPGALFVAFTCVAFAFIGLGLVIAMMADNVPAVQALGQCIFLPMLIIGGVAVPLSSLPDWAQRVSAFFPGRYAV